MAQTSYSTSMTIGREGGIAEGSCFRKVNSFEVGTATKFGLLCELSSGKVQPLSALPSADDDSIATLLASAATAQVFQLTDFDGAIGTGFIYPAQRLSFKFNNHGDWDDTVMRVVGEDPSGAVIVEDILVPNGGNTTVYSTGLFRRVERIHLPAQTGTNGTMDVGTDPTYYAMYVGQDCPGVCVYEPMSQSYAATTELGVGEMASVMQKGRFYAVTENTTAIGDPVYVRMVESGTDMRGQFRAGRAANFALLVGARFVTAASTDGLAVVELS